jgi:hypothetical protein
MDACTYGRIATTIRSHKHHTRPTTNTTKTGEARPTISQSLVVTGKRRLIKLATGAVEFPTKEMQEQARALGHIELVLSQLPMDVLQELKMSATQELNVRIEKTSNEIVKNTAKSVSLETKYNKVK